MRFHSECAVFLYFFLLLKAFAFSMWMVEGRSMASSVHMKSKREQNDLIKDFQFSLWISSPRPHLYFSTNSPLWTILRFFNFFFQNQITGFLMKCVHSHTHIDSHRDGGHSYCFGEHSAMTVGWHLFVARSLRFSIHKHENTFHSMCTYMFGWYEILAGTLGFGLML